MTNPAPAKEKLRLPVWATLFTVFGLAVLIALGLWQVHRLEWKETLLARIAAARDSAPVTGAQLSTAPADNDFYYHPAAIYGLYDNTKAFAVGPRTHNGEVGYHLISALQILEDDHPAYTLLVNRGWVPAIPDSMPGGFMTVKGMLRPVEKPNRFVPPNDPAKDAWYSIDIPQLIAAKGMQNILPYVLYATDEDPADPVMTVTGAYHAAGGPDLPNNHRQYAMFWFAMAAVMAAVYALRFLRPAP